MEKEDLSGEIDKTRKNGSKKQKTCLIHLLNGQQFRCEIQVSIQFIVVTVAFRN